MSYYYLFWCVTDSAFPKELLCKHNQFMIESIPKWSPGIWASIHDKHRIGRNLMHFWFMKVLMVHSNIVLEKDMRIPSQDMTWYLWQPRFITCALLWKKNIFLPRKPVYTLFSIASDLSSSFSCLKHHHQYTEWSCQKHHSFWSLEVTISHIYHHKRTFQPLFPINLFILPWESSTL